ncbi:MAG: ketol-acid reductoisomerase [Phycisphaerales bacterium]
MSVRVEHDRAPDDPRGPLLAALRGRTVAIIGHGSQGRAHALNLRDAGVHVIVGARTPSATGARAARDGFDVLPVRDAVPRGDLVVVGVPDAAQPALCRDEILPAMRPGAVLGFIHGYAVRFGGVEAAGRAQEGAGGDRHADGDRSDVGIVLVAPKGPGATLRQRYLEGRGIPCLFAMHRENTACTAEPSGLAWASGLGCGRAGIVRTTFADETETDLFGEQAVLCGGAMALARAAFETLVDAGYPPELAYLECVHELKQVVDLLFERGFAGMRRAISDTAEFGAFVAGPRIVDDALRERLRALLGEIRDGSFARAMAADQLRGFAWFEAQRRAAEADPIERAGRAVREWMPWLGGDGETS